MRYLELTEKEWEIFKKAQAKIDFMMVHLATLSKEERFRWYKEHQYCYPISFEKEIGNTVYSVTTHFDKRASKTLEEKAGHIFMKN